MPTGPTPRPSDEVFIATLAAEHLNGDHVVPHYETCPGCITERLRARVRAEFALPPETAEERERNRAQRAVVSLTPGAP